MAPRRVRPTAVVLSMLTLAAAAVIAPAPSQAAPVAVTPQLSWARPMTGSPVSMSSPVVVSNRGEPFIVAGDLGGNLRAYDLATGRPRPGWGGVRAGYEIKAPLSSDGANVYVPVAQDGKDRLPQVKKYNRDGGLTWSSNRTTRYPAPGVGFLLAGAPITMASGAWRVFPASSGHWFYGLDGATGKQRWAFRNAESTMATPALADVYGTGTPQVIVSNDKGAEFASSKVGGHLRILTANGSQICSATQLANGRTYASSGYNNSSPAVAQINGNPLIVFGSTGPTQTGVGGNQIVAYDNSCSMRWASAALAGRAEPSPTFADVLNRGTPQVVTMVAQKSGSKTYPRVYVLDPVTGRTLVDTGTAMARYGGALAYPQSSSIVTADVDADGHQDLFVPASPYLVVLSGRDRTVLAELPIGGALQNTPVITAITGGIRVTFAGYSGNNGSGSAGSMVRSYTIPGATLGARGWHAFGNGPKLGSLSGSMTGRPYNQLLEGQRLPSGRALRSWNGAFTLTMQADGNLVIRNKAGSATWSTGTRSTGAYALLDSAGTLTVRSKAGTVLWSSRTTGPGISRMAMGDTGKLTIYSGTVKADTERTNVSTVVWRVS